MFIHFRNKKVVDKKYLKLVVLRECIGYALADFIKKYMDRIKMTSGEFLEAWKIQISGSPVDLQLSFVDPGMMILKNVEKPLNNLIFPVTRNTYNSYCQATFDAPF